MKRTYIEPTVKIVGMKAEAFICASKSITSNNGITYGGVDTEGSLDPASRRHGVWDVEEDF